ncbi:MAG: hypothetical protein ACKPKO_35045, partial [Candidatus Fonsibacter sp.]
MTRSFEKPRPSIATSDDVVYPNNIVQSGRGASPSHGHGRTTEQRLYNILFVAWAFRFHAMTGVGGDGCG